MYNISLHHTLTSERHQELLGMLQQFAVDKETVVEQHKQLPSDSQLAPLGYTMMDRTLRQMPANIFFKQATAA